MALQFPNTPVPGDTYQGPTGGVWTWDGTKWIASTEAGTYAPINSPVFTGNPQAPTPAPGNDSTRLATTAFVTAALTTVFAVFRQQPIAEGPPDDNHPV